MNSVNRQTELGHLLQKFFCSYLIEQRRLSVNTVNAYRDTLKLYLSFLSNMKRRSVAKLTLNDPDADNVVQFLQYLEDERGNEIRTRNHRLAALRAFFNFAATESPAHLPQISPIIAIPQKRWDRPLLGHLEREEIEALISAADTRHWSGQRDQALFLLLYNTGARVSEVTRLQRHDVDLQRQHTVHIIGKGRKARLIPLWPKTVRLLAKWLHNIPATDSAPLFPNRFGEPMTRSGVRQRLICAVRRAATQCPSLKDRKVTPHTVRHTTAMHLLQSGVELSLIALWLGHEQIETTHQYMEASLEMKQAALNTLEPIASSTIKRFQKPSDEVLAFLDSL